MRCLTTPSSSRATPHSPFAAIMHGSLFLSTLLLLSSCANAARSPRQRAEQRNPYLILPPGLGDDVGESVPPKGLGEKEFVSCCHSRASGIHQLTRIPDPKTHIPPWIARLPRPPPLYGHTRRCGNEGYRRLRRDVRSGTPSTTCQRVLNNNSTTSRSTEVQYRSTVRSCGDARRSCNTTIICMDVRRDSGTERNG